MSARPATVTALAVLAALAGVLGLVGVAFGAVVHGIGSLDPIERLIVMGALTLACASLAVSYGAWRLERWAWPLGVVTGLAAIAYIAAVLIRGWTDLMVDAPALAVIGVLLIAAAVVGLFVWSRPQVSRAFRGR